jgi:hypothetical protein
MVAMALPLDQTTLAAVDAEVKRVIKQTGYQISRCEVMRQLIRKSLGVKAQ